MMKFECGDKTYESSLTIGMIRRIKDLTNYDLMNLDSNDGLAWALRADARVACEVLHAIACVETGRVGQSVLSRDDFEFAMRPEQLSAGIDSLAVEITDFFQKLGHQHVPVIMAKVKEAFGAVVTLAAEKAEKAKTDQAAMQRMLKGDKNSDKSADGSMSGNLPESSESIPEF